MKSTLFMILALAISVTGLAQINIPRAAGMPTIFPGINVDLVPPVKLPDSLIITAQPTLYRVNPLDTATIAIVADRIEFSFITPKGIYVYPKHYTVDNDTYTLFREPEPTFISIAELQVMAPGFFNLLEAMILNGLQGNAATLNLYNTNAWTKIPRP